MIHNENSRVKIPAIAHLTRLGYTYLPLKQCKDEVCQDTNISGRYSKMPSISLTEGICQPQRLTA